MSGTKDLASVLGSLGLNPNQPFGFQTAAVQRLAGLWGADLRSSVLRELDGFGSNPGGLRMLVHVPEKLALRPGLVVALHGCGQSAEAFAIGGGWIELAEQHGFVLLLPEQMALNNPHRCFSWYAREDNQRDCGETASIRQMVARAVAEFGVDERRVGVVGLSAGAAMANVLLASYPDVFTAGATIAGLPFGAAASVSEALSAMASGRTRPAREWGDLVRTAAGHDGPWPRVAVWHGTSDSIVNPANATAIAEQWIDVHGLDPTGLLRDRINGHERLRWVDGRGKSIVETVMIVGMGHGVPVDSGQNADAAGAPAAFHFDVGVAASREIVAFLGVADEVQSGLPEAKAGAAASLISGGLISGVRPIGEAGLSAGGGQAHASQKPVAPTGEATKRAGAAAAGAVGTVSSAAAVEGRDGASRRAENATGGLANAGADQAFRRGSAGSARDEAGGEDVAECRDLTTTEASDKQRSVRRLRWLVDRCVNLVRRLK